ncbi:MAG TPA: helicase C-terminal domain-containing protein [Bacillota bacterium]|nr:helicase C-terminal domain-containing protein [Bacillota bacterium]
MLALSDIFAREGLLAQRFPGHEHREGQLAMAEGIYQSLITGQPLAVQAGTGLGKTFAYLIPALLYAKAEGKRVVISTGTLQLQSQIVQKDIPALEKILEGELEFRTALVKGRNNYICMRKLTAFAQANQQIELFREVSDAKQWPRILDLFYANGFQVGDKEEIPFRINDSLWMDIGSESDLCLRGRCPFYSDCYFYKARQKQKEADLLITNHALFFADLAVQRENEYSEDVEGVLAHYDAVILDEAQNAEDYATDHFSSEFTYGRCIYLSVAVRNALRPGGVLKWPDESDFLRLEGLMETILRRSSDFLFHLAEQWPDKTTRLRKSGEIVDTLSMDFIQLQAELKALTEISQNEEQKMTFRGLGMRTGQILNALEQLCKMSELEQYAYWFENPDNRELRKMRLACAPVSVAEFMQEGLFSRMPVVLTSATLASELISRLGLDKPTWLRLDSPFDYKNQARLYLPVDGPEPTNYNQAEFHTFVAQRVLELVHISSGRAFVLFTSYRSLEAVYELCRSKLKEWGYLTMRQGEKRRDEILRTFSADGHAVLFAVTSFWEGVDVQGEALSLVILVKLPFAVPTEPIQQARMEALQREGKEPFYSYTLPQASLRLKQGFGRLIRSKKDCGVIAVLDKRMRTKVYGRRFIRDLPPAPMIDQLTEVAAFYHAIEAGLSETILPSKRMVEAAKQSDENKADITDLFAQTNLKAKSSKKSSAEAKKTLKETEKKSEHHVVSSFDIDEEQPPWQ